MSTPSASVLLATGVTPDEPVAGHYMAHALLDAASPEGPITTDALLARSALAEGSANLAALIFLFGGLGLESEVVSGALGPDDALDGRLVPERHADGEPGAPSLLEFVYLDGFAQVSALARKGGFGRLSQERKVRTTTRDVLHVDRPGRSPATFPRRRSLRRSASRSATGTPSGSRGSSPWSPCSRERTTSD